MRVAIHTKLYSKQHLLFVCNWVNTACIWLFAIIEDFRNEVYMRSYLFLSGCSLKKRNITFFPDNNQLKVHDCFDLVNVTQENFWFKIVIAIILFNTLTEISSV